MVKEKGEAGSWDEVKNKINDAKVVRKMKKKREK